MEAVFAIVVAISLGYWADRHFATSPLWLITGAVIGFAAFVLRLLRMSELVGSSEDAPAEDRPGQPGRQSDEAAAGEDSADPQDR